MSLRVIFSGKVNHLKMGSRSESESEQGEKSGGVDAKLGDLPVARLKGG